MISINDAEEILKKEYHQDNYIFLLDEVLLPDFKKEKHPVTISSKSFDSVEELGNSSICDISVFEIHLAKGFEGKRVIITQEAFRILRSLRINNAIISFVNHSGMNYRISLLTSKYEYDGEKIVKVTSNPKRYSYTLGFGTKTKTAYKFLISKGKVNSLDELISRFSVEIVNKQFYLQIATLFTQLIGGERNSCIYQRQLFLKNVEDDSKYAEFAVRLIGRIMFCWFLREKRSEKDIPLVPDDYFELATIKLYDSYYHSVLEPLFFELLNTNQKRRKEEFKNDLFNTIPYLNGGLFSPHLDDMYRYDPSTKAGKMDSIDIPNDWFADLYKVLSDYNFTVDENTSYDIELSIDPEMLGRIFENLLAEINPETGENAKKSTGSFYTPRDIVDYMVDRSLKRYLYNTTKIDESRLTTLLMYNREESLTDFSDKEKESIINSLYNVTILDPACGSGAFPIGMLQKIVYVLEVLDPDAKLWFKRTTMNLDPLFRKEIENKYINGSFNYIRKLSVIRNSIFGADIQPIASEIARLRCFLSLIIEEKIDDYEPNRGINPLPNLDFKFIVANSLMNLDSSRTVSLFENDDNIEELKRIRKEYFTADPERRNELRLEFSSIQHDMLLTNLDCGKNVSKRYYQLSAWKPFSNEATDWFDAEWMFGISEGFDIVIGNPPYISAATQQKDKTLLEQRHLLIESKRYTTLHSKWDLYVPFMEMGIQNLKNNGILTMIVPYPLTNQIYALKLRQYLIEKNNMFEITDLKDTRVFEAMVENCIPFVEKNGKTSQIVVSGMDSNVVNERFVSSIDDMVPNKETFVWNLYHEDHDDKHKDLLTLGDLFYISKGMVLNSDENSKRFKFKKQDLISETYDEVHCKKYIEGKDIVPYAIKRIRYLEWGTIRCPSNVSRPTFEELYTNKKLLFNCLGDLKVAIDEVGEIYCEQAIRVALRWCDLHDVYNNSISFVIKKYSSFTREEMEQESKKVDLKYVLGIMNSTYGAFLLKKIRGGDYHIVPEQLRAIPIPILDYQKQQEIINVVETIKKKAVNNQEYDDCKKVLDDLVFKAYGLNEDEISNVLLAN